MTISETHEAAAAFPATVQDLLRDALKAAVTSLFPAAEGITVAGGMDVTVHLPGADLEVRFLDRQVSQPLLHLAAGLREPAYLDLTGETDPAKLAMRRAVAVIRHTLNTVTQDVSPAAAVFDFLDADDLAQLDPVALQWVIASETGRDAGRT